MKPALLLLHGALGASEQFAPVLPLLSEHFTPQRLDFEGHGRAAPRARPFRIEHFAENVVEYLDAQGLEHADIFGYSMGGYVALHLARTRPQRVRRVATLGTKFQWSPEVAAREVRLLDARKIAGKVPQFARVLQERHSAAGWETVLAETAGLLTALGEHNVLQPDDFAAIVQPVRIGIGDRDNTVTIDESVAVYGTLPHGELEVLPNTPHPLEKVAPARLARMLVEFFGS